MPNGGDTKAKAQRYVAAAVLDLKSNDLDGALGKLDAALDADPANAEAHRHRGIARAKKRDFDGAIADFDKAARLKPKDANIYYFRGLTWQHKGDLKRAIKDHDKALECDPYHVKAREKRVLLGDKVGIARPLSASQMESFKKQSGCAGVVFLAIILIFVWGGYSESHREKATAAGQQIAQRAGNKLPFKADWDHIQIDEATDYKYSLWLYYRGPPSSLFEIKSDEAMIMRAVLSELRASGKNPAFVKGSGNHQIDVAVSAMWPVLGETGTVSWGSAGFSMYNPDTDQIEFVPK